MNQIEQELVNLLADSEYGVAIQTVRKIRFPANYRYENHAHPEVEIDYINSGCCIMEAGEEIVTLRPGDCIIMNPCAKHLYMVDVAKSCSITQLIYSVSLPASYCGALACFRYDNPYHVISDCEEVCGLIDNIRNCHNRGRKHEYARTQLDFSMLQLFVMISEYLEEERLRTDNRRGKLSDVLDRINNRLQDDIHLEDLAGELGVSSRYIRKIFAEQMGMSCSGYITMMRMEKAKRILRQSEKEITQVAALSGFNSPQYFCRVFKEHAGMTPQEYRKLQKGSWEPVGGGSLTDTKGEQI